MKLNKFGLSVLILTCLFIGVGNVSAICCNGENEVSSIKDQNKCKSKKYEWKYSSTCKHLVCCVDGSVLIDNYEPTSNGMNKACSESSGSVVEKNQCNGVCCVRDIIDYSKTTKASCPNTSGGQYWSATPNCTQEIPEADKRVCCINGEVYATTGTFSVNNTSKSNMCRNKQGEITVPALCHGVCCFRNNIDYSKTTKASCPNTEPGQYWSANGTCGNYVAPTPDNPTVQETVKVCCVNGVVKDSINTASESYAYDFEKFQNTCSSTYGGSIVDKSACYNVSYGVCCQGNTIIGTKTTPESCPTVNSQYWSATGGCNAELHGIETNVCCNNSGTIMNGINDSAACHDAHGNWYTKDQCNQLAISSAASVTKNGICCKGRENIYGFNTQQECEAEPYQRWEASGKCTGNSSENINMTLDCDDPGVSRIIGLIKTFYYLIKYATPVVLVITGSLDFFRATIAANPEEMDKHKKKFFNRLILAGALFLLASVFQLMTNILGKTGAEGTENWATCFWNNAWIIINTIH